MLFGQLGSTFLWEKSDHEWKVCTEIWYTSGFIEVISVHLGTPI